jgi:hypothetical protein
MMSARVVGRGLGFPVVVAGAWLLTGAVAQEAGPDPSADPVAVDVAQPQSGPSAAGGTDAPRQPGSATGGLELPGDFKVRLPLGAAPAGSLAGVVVAGAISITILMLSALRGLERILRLRASAFGYMGFALGGLGLYALMGARLLEVPEDLLTLKVTTQGDASLVETIVAFARRRAELEGDPYDLDGAGIYDGSVNLFLADRVDFVSEGDPGLLEPRRKSVMVEVRGNAVAFYQEVEVLGIPLVVTLLVPVEGRTNALRFGEPSARVGTWAVLPRAMVVAFWDNLRGAMAGALGDAGFGDAFRVERITDGFIHLSLRSGGVGAVQ